MLEGILAGDDVSQQWQRHEFSERYGHAAKEIHDGFGGIASATTAGVTVTNTAPTFTSTPAIVETSAVVGDTLTLADSTNDADNDTVTLGY